MVEYDGPIPAPINKGDKIASLKIFVSDELKETVNLLANENIKKKNIFARIFTSLNYLVWGDV